MPKFNTGYTHISKESTLNMHYGVYLEFSTHHGANCMSVLVSTQWRLLSYFSTTSLSTQAMPIEI